MAKKTITPYLCHIFVCTNDRAGTRKSCGDQEGVELRAVLKTEVGSRNWKRWVRVSQSGCLGRCQDGPNVMIYPQGIWFLNASIDDTSIILDTVDDILKNSEQLDKDHNPILV